MTSLSIQQLVDKKYNTWHAQFAIYHNFAIKNKIRDIKFLTRTYTHLLWTHKCDNFLQIITSLSLFCAWFLFPPTTFIFSSTRKEFISNIQLLQSHEQYQLLLLLLLPPSLFIMGERILSRVIMTTCSGYGIKRKMLQLCFSQCSCCQSKIPDL